jgi:hypothetical protein
MGDSQYLGVCSLGMSGDMGVYSIFLLCIKLVSDSSISRIHSSLSLCMHANTSS